MRANPPRKYIAPAGKMCWTQLKTIGHSLKNLGPFQKTGYVPGDNHDVSFEASSTLRLAGHIDMLFYNQGQLTLILNTIPCGLQSKATKNRVDTGATQSTTGKSKRERCESANQIWKR